MPTKKTGSVTRPVATLTAVTKEMKAVSMWIAAVHKIISAQPRGRGFKEDAGWNPDGPIGGLEWDKCARRLLRRRGESVRMEDLALVLDAVHDANNGLIKKVRALARGR